MIICYENWVILKLCSAIAYLSVSTHYNTDIVVWISTILFSMNRYFQHFHWEASHHKVLGYQSVLPMKQKLEETCLSSHLAFIALSKKHLYALFCSFLNG
jgi:hypothetical protein